MTTVAAPESVTAAVSAVESEPDMRVGVAVLDTDTGAFYGAGDVDGQFPSESVVKILIAANLLATGQMTGDTEQMAFQMITQSDDDDADSLWGVVGGPDVMSWAESYFDVPDLGAPPIEDGWWGNTKFTAAGLVELYAKIKADPVVGPWLLSAMSQMTPTAADGTDQTFGLPSQVTIGAFKQGWGGDDDNQDSENLNSTGVLDNERYAVAILTQHVGNTSFDSMIPVIDAVAAGVVPNGVVAAVALPPSPVVATPAANPAVKSAKGSVATTSPAAAPATPSSTVSRSSDLRRISAAADALPKPLRAPVLAGVGVLLAAGVVLILARRRRRVASRRR